MKHPALLDRLSLTEKVTLCSGADFFTTKGFAALGLPSLILVDGPHGLRRQVAAADHLGLNRSVPATCFPAACLTACSWDRELLSALGAALGQEALQAGVSIVLGPGVNLKRNPLCGRNFEYFSEDPYLAGELATAWIEGLQSTGVGASLKHFAANNQETERMSSDSLMDERTLRELYLPAFEAAVNRARPFTVMAAYNQLNGVACSENRHLLREILRDEWGYAGVTLTDWGGMSDRVRALEVGLDLEMPGSRGQLDQAVLAAIRSGALPEQRLNESVDRLLDLILTAAANRRPGAQYDVDQHHALARTIAAGSAVLLKNDDHLLPLRPSARLAVIGALASEPRYQGAGSSHVNPTRLSNALAGFEALGLSIAYYPGYALQGPAEADLLAAAVTGAQASDIAIVFAGLTDDYEAEGFDRANLALPDSHNTLIASVAAANPNTVVVLAGGAPVEMPWLPQVKAVLHLYLAGQAGGLAAADLLAGRVNPSGKLPESYPLRYADVPSAGFYENGGKQAQYREGLYVGYRYYDKARLPVLFPFGHGLSYTTFEYSDLVVSTGDLHAPYALTASVTIHNTGAAAGAEVVQLYVAPAQPAGYRPERELKDFAKVFLLPGEARQVTLTLTARSFAVYHPSDGAWVVPGGVYGLAVGASSRDLRLQADITVHGQSLPAVPALSPWYLAPVGPVSQADFETLLGRPVEPAPTPRQGTYTLACSFQDMRASFIVRQIIRSIRSTIAKGLGGAGDTDPTFRTLVASATSTPLKNLSLLSPDSMPPHITTGIVHLANGQWLRGLLALLRRPWTSKEKNA